MRPLLLLLLLPLLLCDCRSPRKPLRRGDGGPAVELVETTGQHQVVPAPASGTPLLAEHEPDDDRDHAQPIDFGKGIRGSLQPPTALGAGKGDDDWFSYLVQAGQPGAAAGPQLVHAELSPDPGLDVLLELYDGDGKRFAALDDHGPGEAEQGEFGMRIGQTFYLRVRRSPKAEAGPAPFQREMGYKLLVSQAPAPPGSESEPNDTPELATEAVGNDLSGTLSSKRDEDWFAVPLPPGAGRILRVELTTPGVTPALRIEVEGADHARTHLLDVHGGPEQLRLRNVGLSATATRALVGVRSLSWRKSAAEARYQLRVQVEPPLEGAEQEPNDDCAQANAVPLTQRGPSAEGEIAGFLWPGDVDCYHVDVKAPSLLSCELSGTGCEAEFLSERTQVLSGLHVRDRVVVQVVGKGKQDCFEAPYRLRCTAEAEH